MRTTSLREISRSATEVTVDDWTRGEIYIFTVIHKVTAFAEQWVVYNGNDAIAAESSLEDALAFIDLT